MLPFMANDRKTFDKIDDLDKLIYLRGSNQLIDDANVTKYDFGFVLTTKRILIDACKAMCASPEGLNTASDRTFNLSIKYSELRNNCFLFSKYRTGHMQQGQVYNLITVCLMRNETIRFFIE